MTMNIGPSSGYLSGHLLIAMPQMQDPRFAHAVIYICTHTPEGAMGLVLNRLFESMSFPDLLDQLNIVPKHSVNSINVHFGGPVDANRGFVLHSGEYLVDTTMMLDNDIALTATVDVLKALAEGTGPRRSMLALGYAGWGAGQLEEELLSNSWLTAPADEELLFGSDLGRKWDKALAKIGISAAMLSSDAGHA